MASPAALYELEEELEGEYELEGEEEGEEFLRRVAGLARRAAQSPALRRVGLRAARAALGGLGDVGRAAAGPRGGRLGSAVGGFLSSQLPAGEGEYEWEGEEEGEVNPIRRVYADALMEHMGHAAAEAETEAEAEAFLGALVPLAARLIPRVAPAVMRAAPGLVRGVARIGRTLLRSPTTRPLVRAMPTIARRTAASLAQQVGQGRPVTAQGAVRTLARQTAQVLGNPRQVTQAVRRNRTADRRFHQVTGHPVRPRAAGRPAGGPPRRAPGTCRCPN